MQHEQVAMNRTKLAVGVIASLLLAVASASAAVYSVPFFSQRDGRWSGQKLGTSNDTIGSAGCAITCVASELKFRGADVDPGKLNTWLTKNGGYSNGNLVIWDKAATYNGTRWMTFDSSGTLGTPTDISNQMAGKKLIIAASKRFPSHFVVIRGADAQGAYYSDPYDAAMTQRKVGDGWVNVGASTRVYRY